MKKTMTVLIFLCLLSWKVYGETCTAGFSCNPDTGATIGACAAGTFNPGTSYYCLKPPPGYQVNSGKTGIELCPGATPYSNPLLSQSCQACPAGIDCSNQPSFSFCNEGYCSPAGTNACSAITNGNYCPQRGATLACSGRTYSSGEKADFCPIQITPFSTGYYNLSGVATQCTAGFFCPDPSSSTMTACPAGFYSAAGAAYCTPIPIDKKSSDQTAANLIDCTHTTEYGLKGTCSSCPSGSQCTYGTPPVQCAPGTYTASIGICATCTAGNYCPIPSGGQTACGAGTYSTAGATACTACPGGKICQTTGLGAECLAGTFLAANTNAAVCSPCPAGSYCPAGSTAAITCPDGTYSDASASSCTILETGYYTSTKTKSSRDSNSCAAGYYAKGGTTACAICPDGYICLGGAAQPSRCNKGTYSNAGRTSCTSCETGFACPSGHFSTRYACPTGSFSLGSAWSCTVFADGETATDTSGTGIATCTSGQYSNSGVCTNCPKGQYCPDPYGLPINCPNGTYSSSTGSTACTPCPAGSKCWDKTANPVACTAGSFSLSFSMNCTECTVGHYCPYTDQSVEKQCETGYYQDQTGKTSCIICPANYECQNRSRKLACNTNYYSEEGWGSCLLCPPGYKCDLSATPTMCLAGTYSKEGDKDCHTVKAGFFSKDGASFPVPCIPGEYQDLTGKNECKVCSDGSYSLGAATSCTTCPAGYSCPLKYLQPKICEMGTYSASGSMYCTPCANGYVCPQGSTTATPTNHLCPKGYYCTNTVLLNDKYKVNILPCPEGKYGTSEGQSTEAAACSACTAGYYCPMKGMDAPIRCPRGSYCPSPSATPTKCSAGSYNPKYGSSAIGDCTTCPVGNFCPEGSFQPIPCPPGYFCSSGSSTYSSQSCLAGTYSSTKPIGTSGECVTCPAGAYCEAGSKAPTWCPPGTYNPSTGMTTSGACQACSVGYACPKYGNIADVGVPCPPGFYCLAGTQYIYQYPCPAGKYSNTLMAIDSSVCLTCPEGWVCTSGTNNFTNPMKKCAPGYYCEAGTDVATKTPCPAGKYSPFYGSTQLSDCLYTCPPGKYCIAGSSTPTGTCPQGYYCPAGSSSPTQYPCPEGTYGAAPGLFSAAECITCEKGYYCPEASNDTTKKACAAGNYNPRTGKKAHTDCLPCEEGYYCPSVASTEMLECGYGKYSGINATTCLDCGATYYCNSPHHPLSKITLNISICEAGYLCPNGVSEYPKESLKCQAGYYCLVRAVDPTPCPPGTYLPYTGGKAESECIKSPAGYYAERGSIRPTGECFAGYYCPIGSVRGNQNPCPAGTFRSKRNGATESDCGPCPAGYFCLVGSSEPTPCPRGFYCPKSASAPTKCNQGTFGGSPLLRNSSQCTNCWSGRFCSVMALTLPDGDCDPGYYCESGSTVPNPTDGTSGNLCPAGGVCPGGSKAPQPCEPGYYSSTTGLKSTAQCAACTAGSYCLGEVKNGVSGSCLAGYYCPTGSTNQRANAANAGYYTHTGASSQTTCSAGYYTPNNATVDCTKCPAGYLCPTAGNTGTFTDCPAGAYCPLGSSVKIDCPAGKYSPITNLHSVSECSDCPPGKYCNGGESTPTNDCTAGYYCEGGSSSATPAGKICPIGHYCPTGTGNPIPCPVSTYNSLTQRSLPGHCLSCIAGSYCGKTGLSSVQGLCDAGYYCNGGDKVPRPASKRCVAGQKCPAGSTAPINCPAGTYQDSPAQADCIPCPRGYYCTGSIVSPFTYNCPIGHYCPEGTQSSTQYPCPAGTYTAITNAFDSTQCVACDPGKYCSGTGRSVVGPSCSLGYYCISGATSPTPSDSTGGQCQPGYYCPAGTSYPIPCPPGKACTIAGLSADEGDCNAGYFCTLAATTKSPTTSAQGGGICPQGSYCPSGSVAAIICPTGTYSTGTGYTTSTQCTPCDDGKYCDTPGQSTYTGPCAAGYECKKLSGATVGFTVAKPLANICPAGYYCTEGTTAKVACAITDYQDLTGQSSCKTCPAGYWCTATAKTKCQPNIDKESYYCPTGVRDKLHCGDGKFTQQVYASLASDCLPCPPGKYCPLYPNATESKINTCPAGYYCPAGTGNETSVNKAKLCAIGHYCPEGTAEQIACPPGKYCDTTGLTTTDITSKKCAAGYWCVSGAQSSTPNDGVYGKPCPAGHYCPEGTYTAIACPPGTYRSSPGGTALSDCLKCSNTKYCEAIGSISEGPYCPAGYYCPLGTGASKKYPCLAGYKCPAQSSDMILCPSGSYQPLPNKADCDTCPERYYCNNIDATYSKWPVICPVGKYCAQGLQPVDCPIGTYNPRTGIKSEGECEACPPGKMCLTTGLITPTKDCTAGYFCVRKVSLDPPPDDATGAICPAGYYCPLGTITPIACPPGTINDNTGSTTSAACTSCPERYYCPYRAGTSSMYGIGSVETFFCAAGYLCLSASITAYPTDGVTGRKCSIGKYCEKGARLSLSEEKKCAIFSYNPYEGMGSCFPCPAGRYCNDTGLSAYFDCPLGYYCQSGVEKTPCPAGTYGGEINLATASNCWPCKPGYYCSGLGESTPTGQCDSGYVCPRGSKLKTSAAIFSWSDVTKEGLCPTGHYCEIGTKTPTPCDIGKYTDLTGQTICKACPVGRYCPIRGISDTSSYLCGAGFYCISGATKKNPLEVTFGGRPCSAGYYCPEGTTIEVPCPGGTYEPREGSSACQTCPAGFYCPAGSTDGIICTSTHYCPAGTQTPIVCPDGTYSNTAGLQKVQQCRPCKSGYYCQNGVQVGPCSAGYYCAAGASIPNDPANVCPAGHYCTSGTTCPTVCPTGTVRSATGGAIDTDCQNCSAGYYCLPSVSTPFACPKGYYCPTSSQSPTECPKGYYNELTLQDDSGDCILCPPGYNCSLTAVGNLTHYLCPVGYFCNDSAKDPNPCPKGTYNNKTGLSLQTQCTTCPAGFYCLENTITPTLCSEGKYCPAGSYEQQDCPAGYYCRYVTENGMTTAKMISCTGGYYCPKNTINPKKCTNGYYCPTGSASPIPCPSGTMGLNSEYNDALSTGCLTCPPGSYSVISSSDTPASCEPCPAGYVCVSNTSTATPMDPEKDGGYECPKGYYCPEGTYSPYPCPKGTFNKDKKSIDSSYCYSCEEDTYNELEGQSGCKPCGPTSSSKPGSTICTCEGEYRVFQKLDGKCVCKQYYTSVLDNDKDDSKYDCRPILLDSCASGYLRNTFGKCVKNNDCSKECKGGTGKITPGIGICECDSIQDVDEVCNYTCRNNTVSLSLKTNGEISFTNGATINLLNMNTVFGDPVCTSGSCKLTSLTMSSSGGFTANYQPSPRILSAYQGARRLTDEDMRRILATSTGSIINPAICIKVGSTVSYDVSASHYPVYLKDATANSNPEFDYSKFLELAESLQKGDSINVFLYTFNDAGTYVIADSADNSQQMVVSVMSASASCPDDNKYITPITASNLLNIGIKQNEDIILSPDWVFIGCCFIVILIIIPGIIICIAYLHNKAWEAKTLASISFGKSEETKSKEEQEKLRAEMANKAATEEMPVTSQRHIIDIDSQDKQEGEIDPSIFDDIYRQLQEHSAYVREEFEKKSRQDSVNIDKVWERMRQLRAFMKEKLKLIAKIFGKNIKYMLTKKKKQDALGKNLSDEHRDSEAYLQDLLEEEVVEDDDDVERDIEILKQAMDNQMLVDAQELEKLKQDGKEKNKDFMERFVDLQNKRLEDFKERILENSNLTEGDKQALWKEYEKQLQDLQKQLLLVQAEEQNQLKLRIDARKAKREKLLAEKEKLAKKKEDIKKQTGTYIDNLNKKVEAKEKEIDNECDTELHQAIGEVDKKNKERSEKLREKFDSSLKKTSDPQARAKLLEEYEKATQEIEKFYKQEQEGTLEEMKQRIEKRRREHKEKLDKEVKEERSSVIGVFQKQLEQIREDENIILNHLANVAIEEKVNEAKEANTVKSREEDQVLDELKQKREEQMKKLEEEEKAKINALRDEFQKEEEQMNKENESKRIFTTTQSRKSCAPLNEQRKKLMKEIQTIGIGEEKKAQLQQQLQHIEETIKQRIEEDLKKQDDELAIKLRERKRLRVEKEAQVKQEVSQARHVVEAKMNEEEVKTRKQIRDDRFKRTLEELKSRMSVEDLPIAIEKLLESKHMEELNDLLADQYQDKAKILSRQMADLIENKLIEMHKVKEAMEKEYSMLKEGVDKGYVSPLDYERRLKEMQEREHDQLRDIELNYIEKSNLLEHNLTDELSGKHQDQLVKLREEQLHEKADIMSDLATTNPIARKLISGNSAYQLSNELEAYKKQLNEERDKKIKELELKRQRLQQIAVENEGKIKMFNEETQKMLDELNRREREKLDKKRKEIEEAKRRNESALKMNSGMNEEEKQKLLANYNQELDALLQAMQEEQKRQADNMMKKLEERYGDKERLKNQKQLQLFMYKKEQEENMDSQIKAMQIQFTNKVEVKDNKSKLDGLISRLDSNKQMFLKKKYIAGVELSEEFTSSVNEQVDLHKIIEEDEFEGTLLDIDFDDLLKKVVQMQNTVSIFTDGQFTKLIEGFRVVNNKLNDLKEKAIARKKR